MHDNHIEKNKTRSQNLKQARSGEQRNLQVEKAVSRELRNYGLKRDPHVNAWTIEKKKNFIPIS